MTNCNGEDATIILARSCNVPYDSLTSDPFKLKYGDQVKAKVSAINKFGTSQESAVGNGAIIPTTPGKPTDLQKDDSRTNSTSITFTWSEPDDGGLSILNYSVEKIHNDDWKVVGTVTTTSYTRT